MQHHEEVPLIAVSHGKGPWLYDHEGRRYLDGISSWWVNLFGHANPRINAALKDQLDKLEHAMLAGFTHEPVIELSEQLAALTGHALGHAFYASDGASAVEIALKMSFHYWRNAGYPNKREFVALFKDAYGPLLRAARTVASPDARNAVDGESSQDVARRAIKDVEALFEESADSIAAIIVEPLVQCATGMAMHDPLYLELLRELCDRHHVHLIADEIAVGCGRTGTFFACEQAAIWPDFLCLSKGISGGYLPLSLVLSTDQIYEAFYSEDITRGFLHSHSYTGNALACRAALATLQLFRDDDVLNKNRETATRLMLEMAPLLEHERVTNFRQRGMILAFDAVEPDSRRAATFARRFFTSAVENELLLRPIGRTVYLMPPYVLDEEEIAGLAARTRTVFEKVIAE
jgi:adenosylmethionine-8-amino-7-oxononanoate aminotransferase